MGTVVGKMTLVSCLLFIVSCSREDEPLFTRLTARQTGIDFINENYETETSNILTYEYFYNGGGVALGDINNDGLVDIYFTSNLRSEERRVGKEYSCALVTYL